MTNITPILEAVVTLCMTVLTVFVIPWLHSKTTEQERYNLTQWVRIAVLAAEQLCMGQKGQGTIKKAFVVDFLKKKGFTVSEDVLDNTIEAAVLEMNRTLASF